MFMESASVSIWSLNARDPLYVHRCTRDLDAEIFTNRLYINITRKAVYLKLSFQPQAYLAECPIFPGELSNTMSSDYISV